MPSPETVELRARTDEQLRTDLDEAHQALFNLRFQGATHQLADNSQVSKARRRVARIHTLMREREILAELDAEIGALEDETMESPVATDDSEQPAAEASDEDAAAIDDDAAADASDDDTSDDDTSNDDASNDDTETDDGERED